MGAPPPRVHSYCRLSPELGYRPTLMSELMTTSKGDGDGDGQRALARFLPFALRFGGILAAFFACNRVPNFLTVDDARLSNAGLIAGGSNLSILNIDL